MKGNLCVTRSVFDGHPRCFHLSGHATLLSIAVVSLSFGKERLSDRDGTLSRYEPLWIWRPILFPSVRSVRLQNSRFFLKISKEIGKAWLKSLTRAEPHTPYGRVRREKKTVFFSVSPQSHSPFSASFQTFCLTARAYLSTQKYGLFCSLAFSWCWRLLFYIGNIKTLCKKDFFDFTFSALLSPPSTL